jgi:putative transposase
MSHYRRWRQPGGTFFFTVVSQGRRPVFSNPAVRDMLGRALRTVNLERPVETLGIILLPEHLHCLWRLPDGDENYSIRWKRIKELVTKSYRAAAMAEAPTSAARDRRGERGVWHRRYWEHWIRDELDLKRHLDYIHYNPVKHGLVGRAADWPFSSFARYVASGEYQLDWGEAEPANLRDWKPAFDV